MVTKLSDELHRLQKREKFDGTIIITSKGSEIFRHSYGFSDRASELKNTPETVTDIGSISKTFTAAAILKLVSEGQLALETTVADIFPDSPDDKKELTIRSLLSHSSGLDNFHNETDFDVMSKAEALEKIFSLRLLGEQNESIAYSNAAYTLLAAVVEEVAKTRFQNYVRNNILNPLKLNNTGFYGDENIREAKLAKGYGGSDSGQTTFEKELTWALIGQGGMVSSADDLSIWFEAILDGRLFPNSQNNLMLQKANSQWMLGNIRHFSSWGTLSYYAGGSTDFGYTALVQYLPDLEFSIVILLNSYIDKYGNASHQKLSKEHIFPILKCW
ncbi:serine hydrolase domain-containing protein [Alteromonas oceanisediminis]|uniref:serine hydrolase domain-containing protein n=1 Tax=Alteromonas oceanisediminis TaxID=2836180 RepID=UPI001BDA846A|nr:serine hydrolase domain-containing protein [Alteromonas oceanisediminis]MBT0588031.1 beta-lactamase family protein [Alteromonas oceanisediminis]